MNMRILAVLSCLLIQLLEQAWGFALGGDQDYKYLREVRRTELGGQIFHHDLNMDRPDLNDQVGQT